MKKTLKLILVIMLLCAMLFTLTACGEEEKKPAKESSKEESSETTQEDEDIEEEYSYSDQDTFEEMVTSVVDCINSESVSSIESYIDFNAATAFAAKLGFEESSEEVDIYQIYELINYIDEYGVSDAYTEYEDFVTELGAESEDDLEEFASAKESITAYYDDFVEAYNELEEVYIEITNFYDAEEIQEGVYSIEFDYSYTAMQDGEETSDEDSDTVYFMDIDGEYYIVYADNHVADI